MADGLLTMFGKTYNTVGSADKNLVLLTRGDLKIRWGNKFIDLIKNGKINVDADLLKKIGDKDEIFKDGIYVIDKGDNQEVWLSVGGTLVNLIGEIGTTYVSFVGTQDVDAEKRFLALINAGFYYQTFSEASSANIQSGLIYVVDLHQLYYAKDGQLNKYELALNVLDPLIVGAITIDGKASRIYGAAGLNFGIDTIDYVSFNDKGVNIKQPIITSNIVSSDTFEHNKAGYSIYYDPIRNWHCMEIDYILIRNQLEYESIEDVTYEELCNKVENLGLVKNKKYRITDFQNEWELEDIYYDSDNQPYYYYWPVILTAKNTTEFEKEGYYCDNKSWVIEYDLNYHYYINSGINSEGRYWIIYSKGRITKLTDEYGNSCNYDFKHRKFKRYGSEGLTSLLFTFNIVNEEKGNDENHPYSFRNIHDNWDATQIDEVKVKNNIINVKEPSFEDRTITNKDGQPEVVLAAVLYDECFLFPDCSTEYPHDNKIKKSSGKYIVQSEFHNNEIGGFILNIEERVKKDIGYAFFNNTFGNIYIKGEYIEPVNGVITLPLTSVKEVKFTDGKEYSNNTGLDITNSEFKGDTKDNTFQNIENVIFEDNIESNTFEKDLFEVHFYCTKLKNNLFLGKIDTDSETYSNRDSYPISGLIEDNIFNNIVKTVIDGNIKNNKFRDLKPAGASLTSIRADVNDCIIRDLIAVEFKLGVHVQHVVGYDEEYYVEYDMESVTVYDNIDKLNFKGNITNVDFKGIISNVYLYGETGSNSSRTTFGVVDSTSFLKIVNLDADTSVIQNCKFNKEITSAKIRGTITNCSFMGLSDGIEIGLAGDSLSDMTIQIDIYPSISQWALSAESPIKLINCSPLKVNTTAVPRLGISARKECFVLTINPGNKITFIVLLSTDDTNPSGAILMFYPGMLGYGLTLADVIPKGYAICDGNNGTPNLLGKFIRVAENISDIGDHINNNLVNNGEGTRTAYIQIHDYNLPPHVHTFDRNYINEPIRILGNTDLAYTSYMNIVEGSQSFSTGEGALRTLYYSYSNGLTGQDYHSHAIDITTDFSFSFVPTMLTDDYANTPINIEPNAYALIFIMKL